MPLDFKQLISLLSDFCCFMKVYRRLFGAFSSPWYCPNRSSVLYDAQDIDNPDPVGGENSVGSIYSDVSEGEPSTPDPSDYFQSPNSFNSTDTSFHSIGSRKASSSPKVKSAPNAVNNVEIYAY